MLKVAIAKLWKRTKTKMWKIRKIKEKEFGSNSQSDRDILDCGSAVLYTAVSCRDIKT